MTQRRRRKPLLFIACLLLPLVHLHAQEVQVDLYQSGHSGDTVATSSLNTAPVRTVSQPRLWLVTGAHVGLWTGSFIALNKAWYEGYEKTHFHFFNDNKEWQQMDKAGHTWTAYQLSRVSTEAWHWTGLGRKKSAWLGAFSAVAYQSIIEIQDGYSAEWGFSWGDMAANAAGAAAYLAQDLAWNEQRIQIKLGYTAYDYSTQEMKNRRNQLFGKPLYERLLKDYNSQTYWVSFNINSFIPESRLPKWLNLAVGYNARGMLGGEENKWKGPDGNDYTYPQLERTRHFFLSPDIDLTRIRTNKKWLRSVLFVANMIKIPAPALELSNKGKFSAHVLYW
ncbi:DUF2279 domain-containing protein [Pseudobacter ginsenosidimutans]|uniref:Putative lipoprotein DUF2279 n=1 Tax=Pseudobacter ginsenosidimutans TaxID=661488 RepID=A0A4Q7N407_9BACT|nr:DUF2279 domain-containing protein [Pseudobacter ginsenosidimutans]QEC44255.1 DUF2279 domain-containing protein [Pseudobacter ginsenosidimutans]RZS75715.1 putative lipoprotein DUF2279 [Pseudobacter ginsenosidimutans]